MQQEYQRAMAARKQEEDARRAALAKEREERRVAALEKQRAKAAAAAEMKAREQEEIRFRHEATKKRLAEAERERMEKCVRSLFLGVECVFVYMSTL